MKNVIFCRASFPADYRIFCMLHAVPLKKAYLPVNGLVAITFSCFQIVNSYYGVPFRVSDFLADMSH